MIFLNYNFLLNGVQKSTIKKKKRTKGPLKKKFGVAAQWIRLRLPSSGPGFESQPQRF